MKPLQSGKDQRVARRDAQRSQQWNGAPHRSEGSRPGQQLAVLLRMKARQQGILIGGAAKRRVARVDKGDRTANIEPAHQRYLPPAEWA